MVQPKGDNVRNAVKWISAERQDNPDARLQKLIDQASTRFNLNPMETASLERLLREGGN